MAPWGVDMLRVVALTLLLAAGPPALAFELTILHTNDVHARLQPANRFGAACRPDDVAANACWGGAARLAGAVRALRAERPNLLLLDAGDQFQGTLFYGHYKGTATAAAMNLAGYDAMAVGNHEFDDGPATLARFAAALRFPLLAGNMDATAEPALAGLVRPWTIVVRGGERIGLIGLVTEDTPSVSSPGANLRFTRLEEAAARAVAALEAEGVNKIVVVSHSGLEREREVARNVAGIDVVVGGHSHTLLHNRAPEAAGPYPIVERGPRGEPALVVQAGQWSKWLGWLDLEFDAAGRLVRWQGNPILLDASVAADPAAAAEIARLDAPLEAARREIVGRSALNLDPTQCRARECALGNLVAEATLAWARRAGAVAAIQNGGGLRAGLAAGPVSRAQVLEVLPFGNTVAVFTLSGADLRIALEHGVSRVGEGAGSGRFPQVAGLRFAFDPARPAGERVSGIELDGRPLDPAADYRIAANDFLRRGGDEYRVFAERGRDAHDFGPPVEELLIDALKGAVAEPGLDGRIRRLGD